jgi:hypothetical protein
MAPIHHKRMDRSNKFLAAADTNIMRQEWGKIIVKSFDLPKAQVCRIFLDGILQF